MSDTPQSQPDKVLRIEDYFAHRNERLALDVALDWVAQLERKLAALEQKRRENVKKCWGLCSLRADRRLIEAAFPEDFK